MEGFISDEVNINFEGPSNGFSIKRNLAEWGETFNAFNIEFDIMIDERLNLEGWFSCFPIVSFEILDLYHGAFYCSFNEGETEGLAFEIPSRKRNEICVWNYFWNQTRLKMLFSA